MLLKLYYKLFTTVFNGDCTVYDRYKWLDRYIPPVNDNHTLLDVGCGNGTTLFLGASKGYHSTGLTWSDDDSNRIQRKIDIINPKKNINIIVHDIRKLNDLTFEKFNIITCTETIEHIIDEKKLIKTLSNYLQDKGLLFITTPNLFFEFNGKDENGPFTKNYEDGNHVVRGYTIGYLENILKKHNIIIIKKFYITGPFSKFLLRLSRKLEHFFYKPIFIILSIFFHRLDRIFFKNNDSNYSIGIIAQKLEIQ